MALRVRVMTPEEIETVERLARSRTEAVRLVQRARIIRLARQGMLAPAIAKEVRLCEPAVRLWIERFNAQGIEGLADESRSGRPPTYTPEEVGEVITASVTNPRDLGLPFGSWTLDRLEAYLNEEKGIAIKRSRIDEILLSEGLRWRHQETWFGERVDPEFAEKRGPSSKSTRSRRRAA